MREALFSGWGFLRNEVDALLVNCQYSHYVDSDGG